MQLYIVSINAVLSIILEHAPSVAEHWHVLSAKEKKVFIICAAFIIAACVNMLACYDIAKDFECLEMPAFWEMVLAGLVSSFVTHGFTKRG